jgi:hypothetical protein
MASWLKETYPGLVTSQNIVPLTDANADDYGNKLIALINSLFVKLAELEKLHSDQLQTHGTQGAELAALTKQLDDSKAETQKVLEAFKKVGEKITSGKSV